ncbi:hypothetical protein PPERSA_10218 [Pseudocohnilembus persalinus]|uniref:Uncharacterized protein n=1 Tax=Pseudocohnilembus persalinus TaxID=266149 RepID=A0A0V0QM38_PSEPJ|nr:hypothetical protein PPERSA_10218 [Pseudocohnilembus persalinus]|eukprot:KRX03137.1 hypothetical protein PPERSA_10218 [Pseudocohnilembus persalinus]
MISKIIYQFSKYTKRTTMPKILRDPQFTREGLQKKKIKQHNYDLEQPHVQNKHLYFNYQEAKKLNRERRKQNKILNSPYEIIENLEQNRDPNLMLQELLDQDLLQKPSRRIINNILALQQTEVTQEQQAIFENAIRQVASHNLQGYSFRDFGIFVNLAWRYLKNDKKTWEFICLNFLRQVEKKEYIQQSFLSQNQPKKNISNFIFLYNLCYKASIQLELHKEFELISKASKNYFMENFQIISDMNERALFLSTVSKSLDKQDQNTQDFINLSIFNHIKVSELNLESLVALTHMIYKQNVVITTQLYKEIETQFLKSKDSVSSSLFAIFILSIGKIRQGQDLSKELHQFIENTIINNNKQFTKIQDIAFVLEGAKKMKISKQTYLQAFEENIKQAINNSKNQINYRVLVQILRGVPQNKAQFSPELTTELIQKIDAQHKQIKENDKKMIKNVLSRFSHLIDLESLNLQSVLYTQKAQN